MSKTLKQVLNIVVFLGIGLLLIWLANHDMTAADRADIVAAFKRANYWLVLPAMIIGVFSHLFRAARWNLLIAPLGFKPRLINSFFSVMVGYLVNLGVPRVGEISRCAVLARYEKIPAEKLIGTLIAERAVDVVCLLLLILATIISQLALLGDLFQEKMIPLKQKIHNANYVQWLIGLVLLALLVLVLRWLFKKMGQIKLVQKVRAMARGVMEGLLSIGKMKNKWMFLTYTLLIWGAYFSMLYCGFFCLEETSHLGLKAAMAVLSMGSIGMIVTPGGIGAYPPLVQETLLLYNISKNVGKAFGWIIWLAQTILVITLGLISLICLPIVNRERKAA
ncbi:hypothetical protein GA0116948_114105 [Chitinophaga costaii]|uniref:Lysylphosphatidylglycerol synthase TM region n=1 Tax=Chitinophaga costaii TaxID=1335309 RepID=A0A1C4FIK7_9BACT|nr:lysylphosphatidylglycerol synthase transmembrane domain-containing protein [Chitinophaga costaii]PUZ20315.1 UPF0104 family protein [Chitinophaga costaii]SCC55839.1 hypothetical protein GA0116948_114105 [Chitinophaga costaii]